MSWESRAACRGHGEIMFSEEPATQAVAVAICARCPVAARCREASRGQTWGVWAGEVRRPRWVVCVDCDDLVAMPPRSQRTRCDACWRDRDLEVKRRSAARRRLGVAS